jgi:uncharacterized protein (TIGR02271 family)
MEATTHSIEVIAPLRMVYNQWTQFEEFPHFMEGIEEVRQEGDKRLFWKAKVGGKVKEWEAEIIEQVPDQRVVWRSVDGSSNAGTITFEELSSDRTRVSATIEYEPEGFLEKTGDALGIPSGRVERDLERFRNFIEDRGRETGAWRGRIEEGKSSSQASEVSEGEGSRAAPAASLPKERPSAAASYVEVPLSKEEVEVGKREVSAGDIKLRKKVETEQVNVPVELKREDVVVERVAASEAPSPGKEPFNEEQIEIPLKREEPVVEKQTRVTGGVRVRKTEGAEQHTVQEKIRREEVDIDESGKAEADEKSRREMNPRSAGEKP